MRAEWREPAELSTEMRGRMVPDREENFPNDFGIVARALWPRKTAHELAAIANKTDRAAKEWLNGKVDPPAIIIAAIVARIVPRP